MPMQQRRTATVDDPPAGLAEGQLAVEMAGPSPKLWTGVPNSIDPSGRRLIAPVTMPGDMRWNSGVLQRWDGTAWTAASVTGITDGSNVAPGEVGEFVSDTGNIVWPFTAPLNTSTGWGIGTLPPGDWDVSAWSSYSCNTAPHNFSVSMGTADDAGNRLFNDALPYDVTGRRYSMSVSGRSNLNTVNTSAAVIYLGVNSTFSGLSTFNAIWRVVARRVR